MSLAAMETTTAMTTDTVPIQPKWSENVSGPSSVVVTVEYVSCANYLCRVPSKESDESNLPSGAILGLSLEEPSPEPVKYMK